MAESWSLWVCSCKVHKWKSCSNPPLIKLTDWGPIHASCRRWHETCADCCLKLFIILAHTFLLVIGSLVKGNSNPTTSLRLLPTHIYNSTIDVCIKTKNNLKLSTTQHMSCAMFTYWICKVLKKNHKVWLFVLSSSTAAPCVRLYTGPQRQPQYYRVLQWKQEQGMCNNEQIDWCRRCALIHRGASREAFSCPKVATNSLSTN